MHDLNQTPVFPFGFGKIGLHECVEHSFGDMPALTGFMLANITATQSVLWVRQSRLTQDYAHVMPRGLMPFSWANTLCLNVKTFKRQEALWAIEEGMKSGGVQLVIGEVEEADFTATRRLKLASERYGVPVVLLMPYRREGVSACETRWRVRAQPSAPNPYDPKAPGCVRWEAVLEKCRQAPERLGQVFDLEYDHEALSLRVVPRMAVGQAEAGKASTQTSYTGRLQKTA
jgi:protein ImuA